MASDDLHRPGACRAWRALALAMALSGCGAFQGPDVPKSASEHSLCYTRLASTPAQLRTLAKDACGETEPRFDKEAMDISACPLLVPERVYFGCT